MNGSASERGRPGLHRSVAEKREMGIDFNGEMMLERWDREEKPLEL